MSQISAIYSRDITINPLLNEYETIDNGRRPFIVSINSRTVDIYENRPYVRYCVCCTTYRKVFIGDNDLNDSHYNPKDYVPGNSILVNHGSNEYIYIGHEIYSFKTAEPITAYYSPISNNQVSYPYAVSEKSVYFMLDKVIVPVEQINLNEDGYRQFYDKADKLKKNTFKVDMLRRRQV